MTDYAIGDVQGCYDPLMRLLDYIKFDDRNDQLWFTGDLVNRGSHSLETLRFIKSLVKPANITLGNHDLHLLSCLFTENPHHEPEDNLDALLHAPDGLELGHWLRKQSLLYYSPTLNMVMCHAGIYPFWDLDQAINRAHEVELILAGEHFQDFLQNMYGNKPDKWSEHLSGMERLRFIVNSFTRMRFCYPDGLLDFRHKATIESAPADLIPWYMLSDRKHLDVDLVFGHWAALMGICPVPNFHAIDTGCIWGGKLTALRLQDRTRFSVKGV